MPKRVATRRADRVTIAMVASAAGVSVPTVSKVLNGRDAVGPETRRRVQDALEATGYQRRARSEPRKVGLVDFVITELDTAWASELLRGAEQEAYRLGARLVLTVTHDRQANPREWLAAIASRPTDGVVLVGSGTQHLGAARLRTIDAPFVVVDQVGGFDKDIPTIGATNWAGGFAATEHLIGLGHERIGMITGPDGVPCSMERLDGYRAALRRAGLPVDERLIRPGDFYPESGRRGAADLLDLPEPPTAVFAASDQQAAGVYEEVHARGLRVPDDLSVVGFDDTEVCEWTTPKLTTIRQPLAQMAMLAVRNVLEAEHPAEEPLRLELSTSLVIRDSTAAPSETSSKQA
ncbi:LacI family DNA-binding transcriptional regulator [Herbidospora sp. NBRC 101105]|uniref:LacI family DNA-binding transcriptional regulator n=1 Tax=Herbidospora sp. NBRC 101105 TaxID=3032195 RepID=UPI0024A47BBB|nr:LacI family DNA-binding transcriptional regulator [Herbidospora sp. NBRC 101105]GLX93765.1 LacI family transcriptional regulator [Herbidospora sp. NBRC 101105]